MFKDLLKDVVERTDGSIGGLIMGFDGITLEHYLRAGKELDVETVGMEWSVVLGQISKAAEQLDAGDAREVSIKADNLTTVIRLLNKEYFVALTLAPEANDGKGRYLLRTLAPKLLEELT
jgi:predicted regulator of Ras-like GTPase activity (Roadblock/LC7/MglB family)